MYGLGAVVAACAGKGFVLLVPVADVVGQGRVGGAGHVAVRTSMVVTK